MYYRGAQAAIVVYDITNPDTFARAKNWVKELQRQVRARQLGIPPRWNIQQDSPRGAWFGHPIVDIFHSSCLW